MRCAIICGLAILLLAASAPAQAPTGQIFGSVRDPGGLAVPAIRVAVLNELTGQRSEAVTNQEGDYIAAALPPGRYTITAEKEGFKTFVRQGVTVTAFQNVRVDASLEVGAVTQNVVVSGDAPLVDTRTSTLGALVDERRIVGLPLNGRNVVSLMALIPGVTRTAISNDVSYNQQRVNVNGSRSYATNMQLDGGSMYYAHRGQGLNMPPPDAVEEIKMIGAGVTAEYGRGTAVMSVVTKSGTNKLHGTLWEYLRNDKLDARGFFDAGKAKLRYNQFGGTLSGPIARNRLFYFVSYQGRRIPQQVSANSAFPPTEAERSGNFSASNPAPVDPLNGQPFPNRTIPQSRMDPVALKVLGMVPLPNEPSTGRLSALEPAPLRADNVVGKFDFHRTDRDRISFRYYFDYQRGVDPFPNVTSPGSNIPGYSQSGNSDDIKTLTANHMHTWSPNLISTARGSFSRFIYDELNSVRTTMADLGARNFVNGGGPPHLPQLIITGRFVVSPSKDNQRNGTGYDFAHDWSWFRGRHELKWGVQAQQNGHSRWDNSAAGGRFIFDGTVTKNVMADFLLGRSVNFSQNSVSEFGGRYWIPAFYGQDNFKASRRLTLNLGLRWEVYTPWREDKGQMTMYIPGVRSKTFPTAPLGTVYQSDPEYDYGTDWINLGPRIGFAWDPLGDGKMSVRGGYAVSYDASTSSYYLSGNQPFWLNVLVSNPGPLSDPYANTRNPFPYKVDPRNAVFELPSTMGRGLSEGGHVNGDIQAAYTQNLSITVERQIAANWMIKTGYIGNLGRKLPNKYEFNPAVYIPGKDASGNDRSTTKNTDARRRFAPLYTAFAANSADANSSYHSLQTVLTKRLGNGLTIVAHHTWSKAIDDSCTSESTDGCQQQDPFNRRGSRGLGDQNRTHVAAISYVYELPFLRNGRGFLKQMFAGWQVAGINTFQSGAPVNILTGSDASLTGVGRDRPDVVGDPKLPGGRPRNEQIARWFNTSAFRRNSPGQYGNAARNIVIGPGAYNWDLSLQKRFALTGERHGLEFRSEFFNFLNHANLGQPQATLSSSAFGRITSASAARVVQFALRYAF